MRVRVWSLRRPLAALLLAGAATAAIVGVAHHFEPGPDHTGGLQRPAAVQGFTHVQQTDPDYSGG
ncbi:hypothetical protein [Streptacidiphilus jiangxiensis]|uniref:hypothetical protein n=1 Tax=Streptacidiphilus jiangxiensis TaxID=235985 RepID=UPI001378F68C|nr:hypothetical protein [Streptacidiphilus jiangxiensis]